MDSPESSGVNMKGRNAQLDVRASVVANKAVRLNGRLYQAGDVINDSTVAHRLKEKLYRVGVITTAEDYAEKRNKYGRVVEPVVAEEATDVVGDAVDEKPAEELQEIENAVSEEEAVSDEVVAEEATDVAVEETVVVEEVKEKPAKKIKAGRGRPRRNF